MTQSRENKPFNGEKIKYPVTFDLKIIMDATVPDHDNKTDIARILYELEIPFSHWRKRLSTKGNYVRFSVSITLDSQDKLNSLYQELKKIDSLKFAV